MRFVPGTFALSDRRLAVPSLHDALWWALAATIAALGAVLLWMIVTPVSPLGAWRPAEVRVMSPMARSALFAQIDPFNRGTAAAVAAGPGAVTSLALTLFGVRVNAATGGGSAIIAGADGIQQVYLTGTEVQPGVVLTEVHFDHVGLTRNGGTELLYLDQSKPAPGAATVLASTPAGLVGGSSTTAPLSGAGLRQGLAIQPQAGDDGRISGLQVSAEGDGAAFRAAGFHPGDVIVQVAGKPVGNAGDGVSLLNSLKPGGSVAVTVQRGGKQLPLAITVSR